MTAAFRLVHFIPNPQRGDRFTVGGLVKDAQGTRAFVAPRPPGLSALGDAARERLLTRSLIHLSSHTDFNRLAGFGPYFRLGEERTISAADSDHLVQRILTSISAPPSGQPEHERGQGRQMKAWRWVQHYGLEKTVRRRFQAGVDDGAFLPPNPALDRVSQYVMGSQGFLLLEPLVVRPQLEEDIRKVTQRLTTYRDAFSRSNKAKATVRVYGLDLKNDALRKARAALDSVEIEFVDTTDSAARRSFVKNVRDLGGAPLLRA
jgi:hypothetical protein